MPAVLVHGVPDTHHLWDRVVARLRRDDVVTPDLPGFGCPRPEGFPSTCEAYLDWLVGLLEGVGEPVDLVGHDWGSLLVQRLATVRPDLVRTLAFGGAALEPSYSWHEAARAWQTPGVGEAMMEAMTPGALEPFLVSAGWSPDDAAEAASRVDGTMRGAVLALYRSATELFGTWGREVRPPGVPALAIWGEHDEYVPVSHGRAAADLLGAELEVFEGCGHWWPTQEPDRTAAALERLWARAAARPRGGG